MKEAPNILIIDDVSSNLLLLQSILEADGYEVTPIDNGREALEVLKNSNSIELILLDIMMPDLDGYEFLDLKNETLGGEIPVIIVSAKTDTDSIQQAIDKGAYDYISKPFNTRNIINKIRTALGNQDH
jgi:CheY-like chemotaxis protein